MSEWNDCWDGKMCLNTCKYCKSCAEKMQQRLADAEKVIEFYGYEDDETSMNKEYCKENGFDFTNDETIVYCSDVAKNYLKKYCKSTEIIKDEK